MATDGGDNKGLPGSSQYIEDLEDNMTGRSRSSAMTLEHGDRQSIEARPCIKRNLDTNKRTRKQLRRDIENVRSELVNCISTCRQPLGNMLHLHTPVRYCSLAEGQGSAVLHILVRKVQWENHVFHVRSDRWNQTLLSGGLLRSMAQATSLTRISPQGDTLNAYFECSDLPLRHSGTNSALMTKTCSGIVSEYGLGCHGVFLVAGSTFFNLTCTLCYPLIIQQSTETSADSQCNEQLQTTIDITTKASVEDADREHTEGEHLSSGCYFSADCNQKYPRGVYMVDVGKLIFGRSCLDSGQLNAVSETLNSTDNAWTLMPIRGCRNVRSQSSSISQSGDCNIAKYKQSHNKFNKGDNRSNRSNDNLTSCQIINHKYNQDRKNLSMDSDNINNKNNNSQGHNVDSDGSSDSEIDCTHDENNIEVNGQSPVISNAEPPTEYHTDAENLQGTCIDSVDEYFTHISFDSSGNSTQIQLEHGTDTSMGVACESVTFAIGGGNCKRTIHNCMRKLDVSQPTECRGEKLVGESGQEFCICNESEEFFYSGKTGVETRPEMETQNNPEEKCSIGNKSTDTALKRFNSSTNQVLQLKEENTLNHEISLSPEAKKCSDNHRTCEDSATGTNRCLSQVCGDGFKISPDGVENLSQSQEDFTENNGTLQSTCQNKTVDSDGMTNTEPAKPDRILRGFDDELECLKCWEGSVHVRQTGLCCLEDIKCVNFLGMLTNKLTEHTNKDAPLPNQKRGATSADKSGQLQPEHVLSDKAPILRAPHNPDKKSASFCGMTAPGTDPPQAHAAKYDQKRRHTSIPTTEISAEVVELEHIKTEIGPVNKIQLSSEQIVSSNVPKKMVQAASTQDIRPGCTEEVHLKTPSISQLAEDRDFCEVWPSKYTMSLSDRFLHKYDLLTMQSKQRYKKPAESPKTEKNDATRNTNFEFEDPAFEVDVFRSMEYATSLSCGLGSEKRSCGPAMYEHSNFDGEVYDSSAAHLKENSHTSDEQGYHRETVSVKPPEGQKRFSVSMSDENTLSPISEGEAVVYSRDRMMRASERRKKLMTEFEEITSCVDVNGWPRYDKGNYCYESGNFNHDVESSMKRQVNDLNSAVQSEGKHMIGTLTVEYLNPPVSGFVFLK